MKLGRQIIDVGVGLVQHGLSDGKSGNVSARCIDGVTAVITPSAIDYRMLTVRDLVRIHLESGEVIGKRKPSSEWRMHTAIYRVRPDVGAVIHHHALWASAVAVARGMIPILTDEVADIGAIRTAHYAPSGSPALATFASGELSTGSNAVLLANHGAVVVGRDLEEAWRRALAVERLAKIYVAAEILGGAHALDDAEASTNREFFEKYRPRPQRQCERIVAPTGAVPHLRFRRLAAYALRLAITLASLMPLRLREKLHL